MLQGRSPNIDVGGGVVRVPWWYRSILFSLATALIFHQRQYYLFTTGHLIRGSKSSSFRNHSLSSTVSLPSLTTSAPAGISTCNPKKTAAPSIKIGATSTFISTNTNPRMVLRPLVICGPSGVGKGTIIEQFMTLHGGAKYFGFTVSHTTRAPRPGEVHGIHYYFTNKEAMQADIDAGKFLEYAAVHGNLYGTSLDALYQVQNPQTSKFCLLDIDVQGVQSVKKAQEKLGLHQLHATFVFIAPPSLDVLRQRLIGRGTESTESIEKRSKNAIMEMEYGTTPGNFDYTIVNDTVDKAVEELKEIVQHVYGIDMTRST